MWTPSLDLWPHHRSQEAFSERLTIDRRRRHRRLDHLQASEQIRARRPVVAHQLLGPKPLGPAGVHRPLCPSAARRTHSRAVARRGGGEGFG